MPSPATSQGLCRRRWRACSAEHAAPSCCTHSEEHTPRSEMQMLLSGHRTASQETRSPSMHGDNSNQLAQKVHVNISSLTLMALVIYSVTQSFQAPFFSWLWYRCCHESCFCREYTFSCALSPFPPTKPV